MAKTAIITGASAGSDYLKTTVPKFWQSKGIGKHSAIALSKAGWNVVLIARREQELQETSGQCPSPTLILLGDITNESFVKEAFEVARSHFGMEQHHNAHDNTNGEGIHTVADYVLKQADWTCYLM